MYLFCIGKDKDNFVIWKKYNEIFTKNLKMLSVTCSFIRVLIMPINLAKVQTLAKCVAQKRHTGVFRRISGGL
ncbi:hypothetical protein HMPREF1977_0083 [Capnocytophaga ochracea F0287]|uniref:Uncharacterized protein n=1 Tax=Capnocytophaga ochracea F0287 TaxID=873517 RepID=E4MNX3_CAPOC|nr:hypothetical protein HMPREF1977_0083 [Capnocytophaga ochracea F0287]